MKIGDYVRTKNGLIAKYIEKDNEVELHRFDGNIQWYYEYYRDDIDYEDWEKFINEDVVKSSPNIIDLIEVGDYVNGHLVFDIAEAPKRVVYIENNKNKLAHRPFEKEDIKSIVTKEQFKSMEYNWRIK